MIMIAVLTGIKKMLGRYLEYEFIAEISTHK